MIKLTCCSLGLIFLLFYTSLCISKNYSPEGEKLFIAKCAQCHGKQGEGFLKLYPPLQNSRFLSTEINQLPCIIKFGINPKALQNEKTYKGTMVGTETLSNTELYDLIEYLIARWGHDTQQLFIDKWLNACKE